VKILDRLPYSADATLVAAPGASVRVKPNQMVVDVSVSLQIALTSLPAGHHGPWGWSLLRVAITA
jgi:hypothetical protein